MHLIIVVNDLITNISGLCPSIKKYKKNKNDKPKPLRNNDIKKILIWSSISDNGKSIKYLLGKDLEIYNIEEMIEELIKTKNEKYKNLIDKYKKWTDDFFNFLNNSNNQLIQH